LAVDQKYCLKRKTTQTEAWIFDFEFGIIRGVQKTISDNLEKEE